MRLFLQIFLRCWYLRHLLSSDWSSVQSSVYWISFRELSSADIWGTYYPAINILIFFPYFCPLELLSRVFKCWYLRHSLYHAGSSLHSSGRLIYFRYLSSVDSWCTCYPAPDLPSTVLSVEFPSVSFQVLTVEVLVIPCLIFRPQFCTLETPLHNLQYIKQFHRLWLQNYWLLRLIPSPNPCSISHLSKIPSPIFRPLWSRKYWSLILLPSLNPFPI